MPQPLPMKLALNVNSIEFPNIEIIGYSETFGSTDELKEIRERYFGNYFVRRYSDNQVFVIPMRPALPPLGDPLKINLSKTPYLVAALVRDAVINYLSSIQRQVIAVNPITFLDTKTDLLSLATNGKAQSDLLVVRPAISIDIRVFEFEPTVLFVGSALTVRVSKSIEAKCSALLTKGINLVNGLPQ